MLSENGSTKHIKLVLGLLIVCTFIVLPVVQKKRLRNIRNHFKNNVNTHSEIQSLLIRKDLYEKRIALLKDMIQRKKERLISAPNTEEGMQVFFQIIDNILLRHEDIAVSSKESLPAKKLTHTLYELTIKVSFATDTHRFTRFLYTMEHQETPCYVSEFSINRRDDILYYEVYFIGTMTHTGTPS